MAQDDITTHTYEVRLFGGEAATLVYVTSRPDDRTAAAYAGELLAKYPLYDHAEVWRGMILIARLDTP